MQLQVGEDVGFLVVDLVVDRLVVDVVNLLESERSMASLSSWSFKSKPVALFALKQADAIATADAITANIKAAISLGYIR